MADERLFCSAFKIPLIEECMQMAEWAVIWQASAVVLALIGAGLGGFKFLGELRRLRGQREDEASLRRTEFFLAQHRRLFDDPDLASVLQHLDGDDEVLAEKCFWERKRKFLTFIEEIKLLITSKKLKPEICFYMFGYYAICARDGKNFNAGIDDSLTHWKVFHSFCEDSATYRSDNPDGPSELPQL
jgi:hypothetical protein